MARVEEELSLLQERLQPPALSQAATPRLSTRWASALGLAWLVGFPLGIALEPVAATDTTPGWIAGVASFALLGAIGLTAAGLIRRSPLGVTASVAASGIFIAGVFACPATGHHAMGLWWFGELACAVALVALSSVAWLRTR
jgi:hypothetical protein